MTDFPEPIDFLVAGAVFIAGWIYAIVSYGFFLGVGLGWIPAIFLAIITIFIWRPVMSIAILGAAGIAVWAYLVR